MKLTKRKALEICRDLWKWLAKHPEKGKYNWPMWKLYGQMHMRCPCCEYNSQHSMSCEKSCLIKWPGGGGCCNRESPYFKWTNNGHEPVYAIEIVKLAEKELRKLKKKVK